MERHSPFGIMVMLSLALAFAMGLPSLGGQSDGGASLVFIESAGASPTSSPTVTVTPTQRPSFETLMRAGLLREVTGKERGRVYQADAVLDVIDGRGTWKE